MSYKAEVIADSTNTFVGNGLRFATREEAECYVMDLMMRWTSVQDWRVVESDERVNYCWTETGAKFLDEVSA